eukprot:jgi/Tetstr1/434933/TSEL_023930.t2
MYPSGSRFDGHGGGPYGGSGWQGGGYMHHPAGARGWGLQEQGGHGGSGGYGMPHGGDGYQQPGTYLGRQLPQGVEAGQGDAYAGSLGSMASAPGMGRSGMLRTPVSVQYGRGQQEVPELPAAAPSLAALPAMLREKLMQYPPEMQRAFLLKYQPQIQAHAQAQGQAQAQAQGPARASPGTPAGSVYTGQSPAASGQTGDSPSLGMEYQQAPHYTQQQVGYARQQGHMEAAGRHRDVSSRQHYSGGGMAYPQSSWDAGVGSPRPPPPQQLGEVLRPRELSAPQNQAASFPAGAERQVEAHRNPERAKRAVENEEDEDEDEEGHRCKYRRAAVKEVLQKPLPEPDTFQVPGSDAPVNLKASPEREVPPVPEEAVPQAEPAGPDDAGTAEGALWITRVSADAGFDPHDPKLLEPVPEASPEPSLCAPEAADDPATAAHTLTSEPESRRLPLIQRVVPAMSFKRCAADEAARGKSVLQWVFGVHLPTAWK